MTKPLVIVLVMLDLYYDWDAKYLIIINWMMIRIKKLLKWASNSTDKILVLLSLKLDVWISYFLVYFIFQKIEMKWKISLIS